MAVVFQKPHALTDAITHYCPGCTHGIVHRLVAEVIDELGVEGKTVGVVPVGCSVLAYNYFNCDMIEAPHGRAPAVATGVRRALPENVVFTYQGDGDLAAIGTTPYGRDVNYSGFPIRMCEMLSTLSGVAFAQRVTVDNVQHVREAKAAIKKGFQAQIDKKGFSIIEVLSTCPTNWGLTPVEALDWLRENMIPYYPLGVYKDKTEEGVR